MSIADRKVLQQHFPDSTVRQLSSPIPVRGIGNTMHYISDYAVLSLYLDGQLADKTAATGKFDIEVHLVEDLKANILVGNDVLAAQHVKLDLAQQTVQLGSCQDLVAPISVLARKEAGLKRTIRAKGSVIVPAKTTVDVPVSYYGNLPDDRDFLFEPQCAEYLGDDGGVFAHIVDAELDHVMIRNTTDYAVQLPKRARLGSVVEFNQQGCYNLTPDAGFLATGGWTNRRSRSWKSKLGMVAAAAAYVVSVGTGLSSVSTDTATSVATPVATSTATSDIDPLLESVLSNDITVYGPPANAAKLAAVADEFPQIWGDQGTTVDVPEDEWMPINLKPEAESLKPARVYPVGHKERAVIDVTFDKMHVDGKMIWTNQPTPFSFPVFVVWRDTPNGLKGRVVVDIRGLNKVTISDTYPMPLQPDITSAVAGFPFISTVDAVGWFHQFNVRRPDRHKFTVVSHRGQEQSNVALMGFKGSPPYVQRQTDQMLRTYREFSRAYMDDIIVFSKTLAEHVEHLRQIFQLFASRRVNLAPTKSFLGYPSIMLLGQRVDSLGLSTSAEKIAAIISLQFPQSLRDLEHFLGLTGWLRHCISRYAQQAEPLQARKTALTKQLPSTTATGKALGPARKGMSTRLSVDKPTVEEVASFRQLQKAFSTPIFLAHFDPNRQLYIDLDASKRWGFAAMMYHVACDPPDGISVPRSAVQPILFLSKLLNSAEQNYWPTELEVAGIVWVVKRVRHLIDSTRKPPTIIYTDHSAAVPISRQTTLATSSTDKLNLRLVRASQYLSSFNIAIRHKSGKSNVVPDALSRLPGKLPTQPDAADKAGILDVLYGHPVSLPDHELRSATIQDLPPVSYHITLVEMSDDFKQRLKAAYAEDEQWKKVLDVIKPRQSAAEPATTEPATSEAVINDEESPRGIRFKLRDGLIYYASGEGKERLCVPAAMEQEVFRIAHDLSSHGGFHRTYDRIVNSVYIRQLTKRLRTYIEHCSECQLNQTKRHSPYGSLQPIATPAIPFHTLAIDFILALPPMGPDAMDCAMSVTDKFTKRTMALPGKTTYSAEDWANVLITALMARDWGIPRSIISDRDRKFMSSFWRTIFKRLGVEMLTSTAYHPQTDGQSERTNQTLEIALRFWLSNPDNTDWLAVLPYLTASNNNAANVTTGFAPNELSYGFRTNDTLAMLEHLPAEDYSRLRQIKRESAEEAMAFANVMHKRRYDDAHTDVQLKIGGYAFLKLHAGYTIPGLNNHKLSQQRAGPFKITDKVGTLAYRLELPPVMQIHPVISIAQLEPAPAPDSDPYRRPRPDNPPPVTTEDDDPGDPTQAPSYEIERLLDRRITPTGRISYLVKWKGYGPEHNVWYPLHALDSSKDLVDDYDRRHPHSTTAHPATARSSTARTGTVTQPTAIEPARQQLLLEAPPSTALVRQPTPPAPARGGRGGRGRGRPRGRFRGSGRGGRAS